MSTKKTPASVAGSFQSAISSSTCPTVQVPARRPIHLSSPQPARRASDSRPTPRLRHIRRAATQQACVVSGAGKRRIERRGKWGSIRVSQRHFGAFRGFAWVIRWESPCGSSWKTRSVFQGAVGAFGASTVPSASTGPVRVRQDDGAQWPGRARVRTDGARRVHHGSHAGRQLENRPHGRALLGRRDRRTRGRRPVFVKAGTGGRHDSTTASIEPHFGMNSRWRVTPTHPRPLPATQRTAALTCTGDYVTGRGWLPACRFSRVR